MIERIRQWLYNRRARAVLAAVVLVDCRKVIDLAEGRCNICGHPYVGLAMDCKCTNWGRVS